MAHGKIGQFTPSVETWSSYSERLNYYFLANEIADEKKHSIFLTVCGTPTFQLLRSLVQPKSLADVTFAELTELLSKHYDPVPSAIVRFKFHTREPNRAESVATYVAELKTIARHCKFGNTLNEMIHDRLVCAVKDSRIQRALLQEPNLTYKKAIEISQPIEAAAQDVQSLNTTQPVQHVHQKSRNYCSSSSNSSSH